MYNCHIVLVTYNRAELLKKNLLELIKQPRELISRIWVLDNASTDSTGEVIDEICFHDHRVGKITLPSNIGGAGGFSTGLKIAYQEGAEWVGLMDDDVILHPDALTRLSAYFKKYDCLAVVRENLHGALEEFAAIKYDLSNPLRLNPKITSVADKYRIRKKCPEIISIDCASFEGFFVSRSVIENVGFPYGEYFIYGDDFDYCLRIKEKGYKIYCVRDAVGVRQLPYHKAGFNSWKTYYVWRNFFILHFLYGKSFFVRIKPYLFYVALEILRPFMKMKLDPRGALNDAKSIVKQIKNKDK